MSHISIESKGAIAHVVVDGVELKCATALVVNMLAGLPPVVSIQLIAARNYLELKDAVLRVSGVEATEDIQHALLRHLCEKYPELAAINAERAKVEAQLARHIGK